MLGAPVEVEVDLHAVDGDELGPLPGFFASQGWHAAMVSHPGTSDDPLDGRCRTRCTDHPSVGRCPKVWPARGPGKLDENGTVRMEWYFSAMRTTIDGAGRIVVPKAVRDSMGLTAGREIDVVFTDGRIEIELAPVEVEVDTASGPPRLVARHDQPPLTDSEIRDVLESTRR